MMFKNKSDPCTARVNRLVFTTSSSTERLKTKSDIIDKGSYSLE